MSSCAVYQPVQKVVLSFEICEWNQIWDDILSAAI